MATSGDYSDLSNTPTINNVPAVTSSDDNKVLKASYTGGVGSYSWENETGTTYSAGTGIDIDQNNAISVENPLPSSTSADEGKVLKVDANGDPEWATGGGGSQVQSNWLEDDTTDPSYIENKPTPKTLVAGQGIAISESSASLTVTNTVARDAVNLVAGSGVTLTQSGSDLTISSAGTTYTAGTGIDITNDEISLEAPVDIVAGPGIAIDNPDGNMVRVSLAANEEPVLLEKAWNTSRWTGETLSESIANFEKIKVTWTRGHTEVAADDMVTVEYYTADINNVAQIHGVDAYTSDGKTYKYLTRFTINGTNYTEAGGAYYQYGGSIGSWGTATVWCHPVRIVGIHRIANN